MNRPTNQKSLPIPYYGVAALWLLVAVLQRLDRLPLVMGLSIGVFILLRLMDQRGTSRPVSPEMEEAAQMDSGFEQVLQKGTESVQAMDLAMQQIQSTKVREDISQLAELSEKILREVRECPEKASKIIAFVDYYVPTTLNILNAYRRAEATGIEGENINNTKRQIETMLKSCILVVFHKQLDNLFGADALDMTRELSVLEAMMLREGLIGEKLEAETLKNGDGTDIRLML